MSAREDILGRVRAGLAAARARGETPEDDPRGAPLDSWSEPPVLVDAFVTRLESVGGHVHRVAGVAGAHAAFARLVAEHGAQRIAHSDAALALACAEATGLALVPAAAGRAALIDSDLGLSGAQFGIAETGTLVLLSDSEQNRLVSLVPPVHVALLRASVILGSLDEALAVIARGGPDGMSRAVTFVTGPSRTADIELKLVVGVHGPKVLHVILIDDALDGERPLNSEREGPRT